MKRTRIRSTSDKRRVENATRRELADLDPHAPCHLRQPLCDWLLMSGRRREARAVQDACKGTAEHWHERRKAGAAGSKINPENLLPACDNCNGAVEDYPNEAHAAGLVVRPGDPEWDQLSKRNDRFAA